MNRREKTIFYALTSLGLLLTAVFAYAWFLPKNIPHNYYGWGHITDFALFALLTYVVWQQICTELLLWLIAERIKQPENKEPQKGLKVAFITTFVPGSEPLDLLERIIPALKNAEYPHDTWLLDEGRSKEARQICQKHGVNYFTRKGIDHYNTEHGKFAAKTKGGNHNAWYDSCGHKYDIVAQIDTDFIPRKDFLTKTLGHFRDPRVAFVGTPQVYGNTKRSFVARGAAEQLYNFYGPILKGLYGRDMMMMLGANHVVRVAALKDIGYYEAHLTEDLITGMTLHSRLWKSVYVSEELAVGEGPETWLAFFNQQMRWATGCIDILFHRSPKLLSKMSFEQCRYYLMLMQHYFSGLAMGMGLILLLLNLLFGIGESSMGSSVLWFYVPVILWQLIVGLWLQRFNITPRKEKGLMLAGRVVSIAAMPIYLISLLGVLRNRQLVFKVTPKGEGQSNRVPIKLFAPHLAIGFMAIIGLVFSVLYHHENPIVEFWTITTVLLMFGISFGAWIYGFKGCAKTSLKSLLLPRIFSSKSN